MIRIPLSSRKKIRASADPGPVFGGPADEDLAVHFDDRALDQRGVAEEEAFEAGAGRLRLVGVRKAAPGGGAAVDEPAAGRLQPFGQLAGQVSLGADVYEFGGLAGGLDLTEGFLAGVAIFRPNSLRVMGFGSCDCRASKYGGAACFATR